MNQSIYSIADLKCRAKAILPKNIYDFVAGGAERELTMNRNRQALDSMAFIPRVLNQVDQVDLTSPILDQVATMPLFISPSAYHLWMHCQGEVGTAHAAKEKGIIFTVSTMALMSLQSIAQTKCDFWLQLYLFKDRKISQAMVENAEALGCKALVVTVDLPVFGARWADQKNQLSLPQHFTEQSLLNQMGLVKGLKAQDETLDKYFARSMDGNLSVKDITWLQSITDLPIILKGILHSKDADTAATMGVQGIIVSNHGGRQLDGCISSIEALPKIVDTVKGRCDVLVDGGFESGRDVLLALALGAKAVGIGRPILWGLSTEGSKGVENVIDFYKNDLIRNMRLCGVNSIQSGAKSLSIRR